VLRGDPTTNSEGWTARRACRRGGLPAAGGGGRRELCCGAAEARTGQGGLRVAILGVVARLACNVLWRSAWREELVGMLSMEDKGARW
jgi:hypothetical protein